MLSLRFASLQQSQFIFLIHRMQGPPTTQNHHPSHRQIDQIETAKGTEAELTKEVFIHEFSANISHTYIYFYLKYKRLGKDWIIKQELTAQLHKSYGSLLLL